jgi:hypothetical protein
MKKLIAIILLIVCIGFIGGCGLQTMPEKTPAKTTYKPATTEPVEQQIVIEDTTKDKTDVTVKTPDQRTVETNTGTPVTLQKKEDYVRDRSTTEKCDMAFPLSCVKYLGKDGIVYITIKNGLVSKVNDFELRMNGESCDPAGAYIEPGDNKEFECYSQDSVVRGDFEAEYYSVNEQQRVIKEGSIVVVME